MGNKSMKRKKAGKPFNEMKKRFENKRAGTPFNEMKRIVKQQQRRKKDDEPIQYNYQNKLTTEDLMAEMNEENIDDIDFSKYWSDYDTWGYDKRALGSMKRKKAGQPFNEMKKRRRKNIDSHLAIKKRKEFLNKKLF